MEGITFIAHGGPGSGRYPKGSGKKYLKVANRYSRGYTRAYYHKLKNKNLAEDYAYDARKYRSEGNKRKANYSVAKQLKYQKRADSLDRIMRADSKKINDIKNRLTNSLNVPIKTVERSTIVDAAPLIIPPMLYGVTLTTSKYTKYKVDKKALKKQNQ